MSIRVLIEENYRRIIDTEVGGFLDASNDFNSREIQTLALLVKQAFEAQYEFIKEGVTRPKPANEAELRRVFEPTASYIRKIQEFREGNRHVVEYTNHLASVAESILALSWVTVPRRPAEFIRDMKEAGDYFGNRVLTANKGKELHVKWINAWNTCLVKLEEYVMMHHSAGFDWNIPGIYANMGIPAPPPPPPVLPPHGSFYQSGDATNAPVLGDPALEADRRQLLMQQLNRGLEITSSLKPVASRGDRPKPKARTQMATAQSAGGNTAQRRPPVFNLEGRKWRIEYQVDHTRKLNIDPNDKSESVAMFKCENTFVETINKMNAVTIDTCKNCDIELNDIISSVEMIRCEKCQVRLMGSCPNVTLDNCDSVHVLLTDSSENCQLITAKCTSINVCRLTPDGEYIELPVPEQIRSKLDGTKLKSSVVVHYM